MRKIDSLVRALKFSKEISINIIDVGARFGLNTPWDQLNASHISMIGFEPDEEECKKLNLNNKLPNTVYLPTGLSDIEEELPLYITEQPGCSSIYEPNLDFINKFYSGNQFHVKRKWDLKMVPLDDILNGKSFLPDFIKIDAQGAAFKILKGALHTLDSVFFLEIEVEFVKIYKNEPLFGEVNSLLLDKGFELLDINRYYGNRIVLPSICSTRGQVIFGDVIYYIPADTFFSKNLQNPLLRELLEKNIIILCLYGYFDIAIEFIEHKMSPFSSVEKKRCVDAIIKHSKMPTFYLRLFNNTLFYLLGQLFLYLGNTLQIRKKTLGWGSDYMTEDGRFKYFRNGTLTKYFRK
jgi:FkbM family methyltransferase